VDLRQELELLKEEGDSSGDDVSSKRDFKERLVTKVGTIFYLKSGTHQ
jgi:hypothetical protein